MNNINDDDNDNEDNWEDMENENENEPILNENNNIINNIINDIPINNIINIIPINNIINQINQNQINLNNQNNNFDGYVNYRQGCLECLYCGKYVNREYILDETCAHCWGFCFSSQLDLENFNYTGPQSTDVIKNFLKKTYSTHPKSCNSIDCIYFKINKFDKEKKLNRELGEFIGIMEPLKKEEEKQKCYTFKNKKRNVKINFKLSNITI